MKLSLFGYTGIVLQGSIGKELIFNSVINGEYEYYFGDARRFGIFGSIGWAGCDFEADDPKMFFDFSVGASVKLWQK